MDNIPQYVRDFLNNYHKLTRRLLSVIDAPEHIFIHSEGVTRDNFYKFKWGDNSIFDIYDYMLCYEIYKDEYRYWWRGRDGISLNVTMRSFLKSGASDVSFHERKGVINNNSINRLNELLDMNDEEFILYIKIMGIVYETDWRNNI